jgi:hypothetical protein
VNFSPAVSDDAMKAIGQELRSWRINCRSDKTLTDLARMFNPIVQGWINYYGRFYKSLYPVLGRINEYLIRWAMRKYKRLRGHRTRAVEWLAGVARREPNLFAHWRFGVRPDGWTVGAPVSGDVHAGFYESREVRSLPATHLVVLVRGTKGRCSGAQGADGRVHARAVALDALARENADHPRRRRLRPARVSHRAPPAPGRAPVAYSFPSKRALHEVMHRIKELTTRTTTNLSLEALIHALNPVLRGN